MKTHIATLIAAVAMIVPAFAGDNHPKNESGPNGGRVISTVDPHAEFFVTKDRKVQITFLGKDGKAIEPAAQVVTVTAGERSAPAKLTFVKEGTVLISEQTFPEGNMVPTVVQIKVTPEAKAVVEKFNANMAECPGCKLSEYACTCSH